VEGTSRPLGLEGWPETPLTVVGVDVATGERVAFHRETGVPVELAIAASCSVPGLFPPVPIGDKRYIDGGLASGTSADLVDAGAGDRVLVIAPMCESSIGFGACAERCLEREVAALRAAGAQVEVVLPDAIDLEAFGGNLMEPSRFQAARDRGIERGRSLASAEVAFWNP